MIQLEEGKYSLPYPLIADTSRKILNDYGVYSDKKLFEHSFLGIVRTIFLINEQRIIEKNITKVETDNHTEQILELYK